MHYAGIEEGFIKKRRQRSSLHAVWWTDMLKFLAALANLPQDDLKNIYDDPRMNSSNFSKCPGAVVRQGIK